MATNQSTSTLQHVMKTPERPTRSRQRVSEASPFTSYLTSLHTPSRSSLPNVLECSPGNFALTSPGFGGYNRDNDARSPSDALASRILLTSPSPRKNKQRVDEPLPFMHKSPLPIFKKRSPAKAGSQRDNLPRFGAELGDIDHHHHQAGSLLDEVDLEHCYYGWNKAKGGDDETPFASTAQPDDKLGHQQRALKRKLFSPTTNTARTLDEVFPLGEPDLLGTENHAPTGSINVTPQRLRPTRVLERELSLQVYANQSPPVSPAGAGSPLLPHHADAAAAASPMGVSLPVPLLLHSPEPREPLSHGKEPMHTSFASLLGTRMHVGGGGIPPLLNLPPPPPSQPDTQPAPLWGATDDKPVGQQRGRGRGSPTSSSDVPLDDSSDEDYTESPVRGRARSRGRAQRGKKGGARAAGGRDSLVMQQVKAAPARRGSKLRDASSVGVPFPPTPLEPGGLGPLPPLLQEDSLLARVSKGGRASKVNSHTKRCNCKRSKCLKLYCDCFAAGLFCGLTCSCQQCYNTEVNKAIVNEKRDAIRQRNPTAFQQKIEDNGQHARGCNCKKSRCKKGYCECYQAGVPCGEACRCCGCENPHGYVVGMPEDDDDDGLTRARAALPLPVTPSTLTSYKAPSKPRRASTAQH